jgi:hypothetical protein
MSSLKVRGDAPWILPPNPRDATPPSPPRPLCGGALGWALPCIQSQCAVLHPRATAGLCLAFPSAAFGSLLSAHAYGASSPDLGAGADSPPAPRGALPPTSRPDNRIVDAIAAYSSAIEIAPNAVLHGALGLSFAAGCGGRLAPAAGCLHCLCASAQLNPLTALQPTVPRAT